MPMHYFDANTSLYHDMLTGRYVTWALHLLNKTPIDWPSNKQAMAETATCSSDFVVSCTCVDLMVDPQMML